MFRAHRQGALAAVIYLSVRSQCSVVSEGRSTVMVSARPLTDLNQSPSRSQLLTNPLTYSRAQ